MTRELLPRVRLLLVGLLVCLLACLAAATLPAADRSSAHRPSASTLLRRADLVRNPALGTAFTLELTVASRSTGRTLRRTLFKTLTHRTGRTLFLVPGDDASRPGALLLADDVYWLLLPPEETPIELALRHVVTGDLSHAGFLRVPLWARFDPRVDGEATLGGVPCWRLTLEPRPDARPEALPFHTVRYWIARDGFLPRKIEFYDADGDLLKTARFTAYQETRLGLRPRRIEIDDAHRPEERAILTLSEPQGAPTSPLKFDLEDLLALRAVAGEPAETGGRELVRALRTRRGQ